MESNHGDVLVFDGGRIGRVSEPAFHKAVKLWKNNNRKTSKISFSRLIAV